jgi:hypothetical protein
MANLDQTADEIAEHYASMIDSVNLLLGYLVLDGTNGSSANAGSSLLLEDGGKITVESMRDVQHESNAEWALRKARNVDHLVTKKAMKHVDDSSWWTSESFTAINKAIAS